MKWHKYKIKRLSFKFKFGRYKRGHRRFKSWGDLSLGFLLFRWWRSAKEKGGVSGHKKIYILERDLDHPAEVHHKEAFGKGSGFGHLESPSFSERFEIINMDERSVIVQEKEETVG